MTHASSRSLAPCTGAFAFPTAVRFGTAVAPVAEPAAAAGAGLGAGGSPHEMRGLRGAGAAAGAGGLDGPATAEGSVSQSPSKVILFC